MKYRLAIFEFDGTLADSFPFFIRVFNQLAEQYGFEIATTAEHPIREDQRTPIPGLFAWLIRK